MARTNSERILDVKARLKVGDDLIYIPGGQSNRYRIMDMPEGPHLILSSVTSEGDVINDNFTYAYLEIFTAFKLVISPEEIFKRISTFVLLTPLREMRLSEQLSSLLVEMEI